MRIEKVIQRSKLMLILLIIVSACGKSTIGDRSTSTTYDPKVEELLAKMSLEEKVGQMTQITLEMVSIGEGINAEQPLKIDTTKLRRIVVEYNTGSILNTGGVANSPERWESIIKTIQEMAINETRLGIPVLYGIDAIHGTNYTIGATLFPQQVGLAASWNTNLVEDLAAVCAYETKASNIPWTFSPVLDLGVDPRWPRLWEGFGEDPYLSGTMGVAMVKGFEGDDVSAHDRVASCLKHFIGYGAPRSGKDRTPAWIPERMMREYFVPAFRMPFDAGAKTVMINSGEVNGIPVHANPELLEGLLRKDLGFEGLAVTDWYDIYNLVERHHIAADEKEATKLAINAGIDMAMVPYDVRFADYLIELVQEGEVPEARIDEAVRRILQLKVDLKLFEKPYWSFSDYPEFASDAYADLAKEGALESITLLKNDNDILPLPKTASLLVTGPNANSMRTLNGGWSYTWQGENTDKFAEAHNTFLEAIQEQSEGSVKFVQGVQYSADASSYKEDEIVNLNAVTQAARNADYVILCVGENSYTEKPGDLDDLNLSAHQKALAKAAYEGGKPVIMVLNEGRPRVINDIEPWMAAIVQTYLPGNGGGDALAEILFGDANPSGKLPYTYPKFVNDLVPYYHKFSETVAHADGTDYQNDFIHPQYPFGFGLSYTTFEYSDLTIDKESYSASEDIKVNITVTNTGDRAGKEAVLLFSTDHVASVTPSVLRLRRYAKIMLEPGESKTLEFTLKPEDLSFVDFDYNQRIEAGEFTLTVGTEQVNFNVTETKVLSEGVDWHL